MPTITPSWSESSVLASQTLARNARVRGTIDLRTKVGAYLFIRVGRGGTTALTNGVAVRVNRTYTNDARRHPASITPLLGQLAAAVSTTINSDVAAAATTLNVASTTGFAADDYIVVGGATAREEYCRVSRVTDSTHLLIDSPCEFAHTSAQADTVRNKADVYAPVWVMGGATYEVIVDYGDDSAGESVQIECLAQVYDSDGF